MTLPDYIEHQSERTNAWLDRLVPAEAEPPEAIHRAMRYSLFAGGKRLRPVLCIAAGEMYSAPEAELMPVACALEMIHTYSLVHDDLPAMDDDDLRRGRPTCHKVYGEAMAILAGDALLTRAFEVLAEPPDEEDGRMLRRRVEAAAILARAAGTSGLIGGQVADLQAEGAPASAIDVERIHRAKTGALLAACVRGGAAMAGAGD